MKGQVNGTCEVKEEQMKKYLGKVKQCIKNFTIAQFQQIPRKDNMETNDLAKMASADEMMSDQVKIQYIQVLTFQKYIKWMEYPTGRL